MTKESIFRFKKFSVSQSHAAMKVNTDSIILGAWVKADGVEKVLDIGTGTGILSLMIAQNLIGVTTIDAVEIDAESAIDARLNFANSPFEVTINLYQDSIQSFSKSNHNKLYDLIISNPPYFSGLLSSNPERNTARQTVNLTHEHLVGIAKKHLSNKGKFALILPVEEGLKFIELSKSYKLYLVRKLAIRSKDVTEVVRFGLVFSKDQNQPYKEQDLVIYQENGKYTKDYIKLTKEFYGQDLSRQ